MSSDQALGSVSFDLSGKVALVTGGSRGLGLHTAWGLARAGCDVVIASRQYDACDERASEIASVTGRRAIPLSLHVGRWDQASAACDQVVDQLGRLDILVNNAGMSPVYDDPYDISEELFDKVLAVNLKGPFRLAVSAARHMGERGGSIVNISSMGAVRPRPDILPYAAAKAGLNALTLGLARALGPGVRCNAIMAGTFATDIAKDWDTETVSARTATFAARRVGQPDEIVGAVLYLVSDAASYTTGAVLTVDGGQP
jgi:NAD(P)-dependent dehydrogenase (short-subunit alcohol dehydrogenase family)